MEEKLITVEYDWARAIEIVGDERIAYRQTIDKHDKPIGIVYGFVVHGPYRGKIHKRELKVKPVPPEEREKVKNFLKDYIKGEIIFLE
jgi:hypothetical protein